MILQVFSIFDSKAKAFLVPFFMHNVPIAQRAFSEACNDPTHAYCKHPEDFTLFHLGTFDDTSSNIHSLPTPQSIGLAASYKTGYIPPQE